MSRLLIIADDITGALDSAAQFVEAGASALAVYDRDFDFNRAAADVIVIDSETRHEDNKSAYKIIFNLVKRAKAAGVEFIYKKTDSVLRGNVGAELAACAKAADVDELAFVPAFPELNRVVKNGVLFINGVPVNESEFGRDKLNPVKFSKVAEILASQGEDVSRVKIYDAESNGDIYKIADGLGLDKLKASAGCAAFAGALVKLLGFNKPAERFNFKAALSGGVLMLNGTPNKVTRGQIDNAAAAGFKCVKLLDKSPDVGDLIGLVKRDGLAVVDATGMRVNNNFKLIPAALGRLAGELLAGGFDAVLMCVGGDVLLACLKALGVAEIRPVCELARGVVLASYERDGRRRFIIGKSGGFGDCDLLIKLAAMKS